MQHIALLLAACVAFCVANTHFDKVSEEFVAKPNGQTAVVKVEMVIESPLFQHKDRDSESLHSETRGQWRACHMHVYIRDSRWHK